MQQLDTPNVINNDPTIVARWIFTNEPYCRGECPPDSFQLTTMFVAAPGAVPKQGRVPFGIRPKKFTFCKDRSGWISAQVALIERLGSDTMISHRFLSEKSGSQAGFIESNLVFAKISGGRQVKSSAKSDQKCCANLRSKPALCAKTMWVPAAKLATGCIGGLYEPPGASRPR